MIDSTELYASIAKTLPSLFECSPAPRGGARVQTPMVYPDGGIVDVFVRERGGTRILTDHGEALGWLRMLSLSLRRTPRQQGLIEDVCKTLGVELSNGQLTLQVGADDDLAEAVIRLAQAVVRVADVSYTFRYRSATSTSASASIEASVPSPPPLREVASGSASGDDLARVLAAR